MIVIGSHGYGGLDACSNDGRKVVNHADRNVLVVRARYDAAVCVYRRSSTAARRADGWPGRRQDRRARGRSPRAVRPRHDSSEAASILWTGGFPRRRTQPARRSAQRAIVRLQLELQRMVIEEGHASLIRAIAARSTARVLGRGSGRVLRRSDTTRERELARYATVIRCSPVGGRWYRMEGLRVEDRAEAAAIDKRITSAWPDIPVTSSSRATTIS